MSDLPIRPDYLPFGRPDFTAEEIAAVARVMQSGWIGLGPETMAFEQELATALRAAQVVTVNSCTAAMSLALRVLGVGPADEIVCPTLTWCSTANAGLYLGAKAVFCDVDPADFCVTEESILRCITPRTKAVMVVHFGGRAVDVHRLRARLPASVAIVEDAAHAFGSLYPDGSPVGSAGNLTCFSFYANKNLSTAEGGAVALSDSSLADQLRSLRQHGLPIDAWKRFTHAQSILLSPRLTELGYKANYTDLQAAIGRVQLRRFAQMAAHRRELATRYLELLGPLAERITPQVGLADAAHARHLFPVRIRPAARRSRDELLVALRHRNIGATIHYALLHLMPLYAHPAANRLPHAEALGTEILTLPISASMTTGDVEYVCAHLRELVL